MRWTFSCVLSNDWLGRNQCVQDTHYFENSRSILHKCHFHCVGWTQQVFNRLFPMDYADSTLPHALLHNEMFDLNKLISEPAMLLEM